MPLVAPASSLRKLKVTARSAAVTCPTLDMAHITHKVRQMCAQCALGSSKHGKHPMKWIYDTLSQVVSCQELGVSFQVKRPTSPGGERELVLKSGPIDMDNQNNRDAAFQAIRDEVVRLKMIEILRNPAFQGSLRIAALAIEKQTKKKVAARAIQAWVSEPDRKSSRRCPEWALTALKFHIDNQEHCPTTNSLDFPLHYRTVQENKTLENAEIRIRRDEERAASWNETSWHEFPDKLTKMEKKSDERSEYHNMVISKFISTLRSAESFDDFKKSLIDELNYHSQWDHEIREEVAKIQSGRLGIPDEESEA